MPTVNGITFDAVKNAVDDLGANPAAIGDSGADREATSVNDVIEQAIANNWLVDFPPGDYRVSGGQHIHTSAWGTRWGLRGTGANPTDAVLRLDDSFASPSGGSHLLFKVFCESMLWKNMGVDQGVADDKGGQQWIAVEDKGLWEDIEWLGKAPNRELWIDRLCNALSPRYRDSTFTLRRCHSRMGSPHDNYGEGQGFCHVQRSADGLMEFDGCQFIDAYTVVRMTTGCEAATQIRNCLFKNNGNARIRVHGSPHPSYDTRIENTVSIMDSNHDTKYGDELDHPRANGIIMGDTEDSYITLDPVIVDDCDVYYTDGSDFWKSPGCFEVQGGQGPVYIRNTRVFNDSGVRVLFAESSNHGGNDEVVFENCHFTGNTEFNSNRTAVIRDSCLDPRFDLIGVSTSNVTESSDCEMPNVDVPDPGDGGGSRPDPGDLAHRLTVSGTGSSVNYEFTTEGDVVAVGGLDGGHENISGTTVNAWITGGTDEYAFDGQVTDFASLQGSLADINLAVNGESVDPTSDPSTWPYDDGGGEPPQESAIPPEVALGVALGTIGYAILRGRENQ